MPSPPLRNEPPRACKRPRAAVSPVAANYKPLKKLLQVFRKVVAGKKPTTTCFQCDVHVHTDDQCIVLLENAMLRITREVLTQGSGMYASRHKPPVPTYMFNFTAGPQKTDFDMVLWVFPEDEDERAHIVLTCNGTTTPDMDKSRLVPHCESFRGADNENIANPRLPRLRECETQEQCEEAWKDLEKWSETHFVRQ